jgi:predicted XRE-type DNA-binding protein
MKKKPVFSKTPPPGWPTEKEWKVIEKKLAKQLPTRILSSDADPIDKMKQDICSHFVHYCNVQKITQRELAKILDVSEARVSELIHYHHDKYTVDKLISLLLKIKPNLKLKIA